MATPPVQQRAQQAIHWRDRFIARSEVISDAWEVGKAYAARVAEWVLFGCLFANILEMFPLFPTWFGNAVLIVQAITLDIAGFGLTTMGDHARRRGNEKAAATASSMGWTLISLMILTVGLVTLSILIPSTKNTIDMIEKALILARVIVTVLYGHVVHSLRQANIEYMNDLSMLQQKVFTLEHTVSTLQPQLDNAKKHVDTLSGQLQEREQEVDTLYSHLSTEQHKVSALRQELDTRQRDLSAYRKQLHEALAEAEALRTQLDGKKQEFACLREQLQSGQQWQEARDRHMLEAEQRRVSMLQEQLDAELTRACTLRRQLDAKQSELEGVQAAMESGRQEVSTLRQRLKIEQQRVSSLHKEVDSGQSPRVSTGRAKVDTGCSQTLNSGHINGHTIMGSGQDRVIPLDAKKRKSRQDAADKAIGDLIKDMLNTEPGLSDRAMANKLSCSPTTVGRWRKILEQESKEFVNE